MFKIILTILAIIFFCLDAFRVTKPHVSWTPLAWACVVAVVLLPL